MNTTIHDEAELWAATAASGGLAGTERDAWAEHIALCPACKKLNDEEVAMADMIKDTLDSASPDDGFEQRIIRRLRQTHAEKGNHWYAFIFFHRGLAGAAACLALVALTGIGLLVHGAKPASDVSIASAFQAGFDALPAAVRNAIRSQTGGNAISSIEQSGGDKDISYTVATKTPDGGESDFTVAEDGTLLSVDTSLSEVPDVVRRAINTRMNRGSLDEIAKNFDDGETSYAATITSLDGRQRNFTFNEDGSLAEMEVTQSELPAAVRAGLNAQIGKGTLEGIDKTFDDGETSYAATITSPDGRQRDFTFNEDGSLAEMEVTQSELPAAVRAGLNAQIGKGTLEGIDKTFDDGETNYVATITSPDGHPRDFTFNEDGSLAEMEVTQSELPAAVRAGLNAQIGKGTLEGIDRTYDDGGIRYEATITAPDGRQRDVSFSEGGKLLSREVAMNEAPEAVRQTISRTLGKGKVIEIDQTFTEPNAVPYEIEGQKDGKPFYFLVSLTGDYLGMED